MTIRLRLVRMRRDSRVAGINTGKNLIVGRVDMAIAAARTLVRNPERRMVEDRPQPGSSHVGSVAAYTGRRIGRHHVIRHGGSISLRVDVVRLVAAVTIGRRVAGGVVAAHVAVRTCIDHRPDRPRHCRTRRQHMRTLQREPRRRVVKLSIGPKKRVVTGRAKRNREARGNVVRHISAKRRCVVPIFQVAPAVAAIHGREAGRVVVSRVAIRASHHFPGRGQLV